MDEPRTQEGTVEDIKKVLIILKTRYFPACMCGAYAKRCIQQYPALKMTGVWKFRVIKIVRRHRSAKSRQPNKLLRSLRRFPCGGRILNEFRIESWVKNLIKRPDDLSTLKTIPMGWGQFYRLESKGPYQRTRRFTSEKKGGWVKLSDQTMYKDGFLEIFPHLVSMIFLLSSTKHLNQLLSMGSISLGGGGHSNIIEPGNGICRAEICTRQGWQKCVRTSATRLTQMIVAVLTHTSNQFSKILLCMSLVRSSSFGEHLLALKLQKKTMEPWLRACLTIRRPRTYRNNAFTHSNWSIS